MSNRVASPWFWILTSIFVAVLAYFTSALVWLVVFVILNARHIGPFTQTEDLIPAVILTTLIIWLVSMVGIWRLTTANAAEAGAADARPDLADSPDRRGRTSVSSGLRKL